MNAIVAYPNTGNLVRLILQLRPDDLTFSLLKSKPIKLFNYET